MKSARLLFLLVVVVLAVAGRAVWGSPNDNMVESESDDYNLADFAHSDEEGHASDGDGDKFLPKNMLSFELDQDGEPRCFYQDTEEVSAGITFTIRGAWFVSTAGTPTVHVVVKQLSNRRPHLTPPGAGRREMMNKDKMLFEEREAGKDTGGFTLENVSPGATYSFCFSNANEDEEESKILTFSVDIIDNNSKAKLHMRGGGGGGGDGLVKPEHVVQITETTRDLKSTIESLQTELEVILLRFAALTESQDFAEQRVSMYTLIESAAMLAMTLGQIYYVRRLVNGRRVWV